MKNILSEIKSILVRINRVEEEEDQTTNMEDEEAKDTQSEWQETRSQDYNNNLRNLWDTIKCKNVCVIGVPERQKQKQKQDIEEIMMENFPNLLKEIDITP